ncbi:unnamed protein product [Schistosoma margrebowiei]|uniref:Uncharacterized protein n=1 Tax=Schistosoma margrebowiei TaxID=48269 RepID=A0A3P7ZZS1_9TREM|nr:unnamed protein product [Schistosoma margrebowiei]
MRSILPGIKCSPFLPRITQMPESAWSAFGGGGDPLVEGNQDRLASLALCTIFILKPTK